MCVCVHVTIDSALCVRCRSLSMQVNQQDCLEVDKDVSVCSVESYLINRSFTVLGFFQSTWRILHFRPFTTDRRTDFHVLPDRL